MARKDITDLQVVDACHRFHSHIDSRAPYEILQEETKQPYGVCIAAMKRAYNHGLLECGVSLRTAWLTAKGQALLDGMDDIRIPV